MQVQAPPHRAGVGPEEEAGLALEQDDLAGFENAEHFQNKSFSNYGRKAFCTCIAVTALEGTRFPLITGGITLPQ